MAWSDKPTDAQMTAIFNKIRWVMAEPEAREAIRWFSEHATRRDASDEMERLHHLYATHNLDREKCFASKAWDNCHLKLGKVN